MAPSPLTLTTGSVVLLLASLESIRSSVAAGGSARRRRQRQRRRLAPHENLHRYLREENESGNMRPKVTIAAMKLDDSEDDAVEYDVDVVQANQAVTRETTYSIDNDDPQPIGELGVKFLVQDRSTFGEEEEEDEEEGEEERVPHHAAAKPTTFALISVEEDTENVHGIVKKQGDKAMNIQQSSGSSMVAEPAGEFVPPKDFRCQVTRDQEKLSHHGDKDLVKSGKRARLRRTQEDEHYNRHDHGHDHHHDHHHHHHHHHNHHHHDHYHHHHHDYNHDHLFSEDDIDNLINHKHQRHRRTTGFPSIPSHQVDLFIEIDRDFIVKNGSNLTTAFRYVNTLVTAASTIYEAEVDTRLTVAHIKVTDNYAEAKDSRSALDRMREIYGNATTWHYTEGNGVDLHHAILGKKLNGGIAFVGSVCSPDYGFGISPNMRGSFLSLDFATVWDTSVLSHELGHNFGVLHTYDRRVEHGGFKPPVDRCFIRSSDQSSCPTESQLEESATLMSYCDACPGAGAASLAYTFGGNFVGDDPSDIDGWRNNPSLVGGFNKEPKRVPKTMYDHISTRTCTKPNFVCKDNSDCIDWRRCTIDTCNKISGQCEHTMRQDCCGNGVCEINELPCGYSNCVPNSRTCTDDCGPYNLETVKCDKCNAKRGKGNGIMIDMQSISSETLLINSIQFRHTATSASTITVYTAYEGSFIDKATSPERWTEATSLEITIERKKGGYATIDFQVPIAISSGSIRSFYIASTGKLISGGHKEGVEYLAKDNSLSIKYPARIVGHAFGGGTKGMWDGKVNYSVYPSINQ